MLAGGWPATKKMKKAAHIEKEKGRYASIVFFLISKHKWDPFLMSDTVARA